MFIMINCLAYRAPIHLSKPSSPKTLKTLSSKSINRACINRSCRSWQHLLVLADSGSELRSQCGIVRGDACLRRASGLRVQGLRNIDWPEAVLFDCDGVRMRVRPCEHNVINMRLAQQFPYLDIGQSPFQRTCIPQCLYNGMMRVGLRAQV